MLKECLVSISEKMFCKLLHWLICFPWEIMRTRSLKRNGAKNEKIYKQNLSRTGPVWKTSTLPSFSALCGSCSQVNSSPLILNYMNCHNVWDVCLHGVFSPTCPTFLLDTFPPFSFLCLLPLILSHPTTCPQKPGWISSCSWFMVLGS